MAHFKINISVDSTTLCIDNHTEDEDLYNSIDELETYVVHGCSLTVYIVDKNTLNYHMYVFDYLPTSKLRPRKWLLNNILYSLVCDDTKKNMTNIFDNIIVPLRSLHNMIL